MSFVQRVSYPIPGLPYSAPWAVAISDLNGDGKPDLAVANGESAVAVLLGRGGGSFKSGGTYAVGGQSPVSVATGGFDGDGTPDLAIANAHSNDVSVLRGRGDGSFEAAVTYRTGSTPEQFAIGDLNGDGKLDLAVPNLGSDDVSLLMGNGDGTFAPAVNINPGRVLSGPFSVAIGDLNRDGKPDLVVANLDSTMLSVLLGNGDGTFAAMSNAAVNGHPGSVAIGDFNRDGLPDLVAASALANAVSVLLGKGDGTFGVTSRFATHDRPQRVAVADLNGDNKLDLATANFDSDHVRSSRSNDVSVLLGIGNGGFRRAEHFSAETGSISLAIKDLNGDRRPDVVTANFLADSVSVFLQQRLCRVPMVRGAPRAKARRAIVSAHCSVGTTRRVFSSKVKKGHVVSQHPRPGLRLAAGAPVDLVISKGKRPR